MSTATKKNYREGLQHDLDKAQQEAKVAAETLASSAIKVSKLKQELQEYDILVRSVMVAAERGLNADSQRDREEARDTSEEQESTPEQESNAVAVQYRWVPTRNHRLFGLLQEERQEPAQQQA